MTCGRDRRLNGTGDSIEILPVYDDKEEEEEGGGLKEVEAGLSVLHTESGISALSLSLVQNGEPSQLSPLFAPFPPPRRE